MDVDMFLDGYPHWEAEGLYFLLILQEMFLYAAQLGRMEQSECPAEAASMASHV